jgi:hypothetical protein
MQKFKNLTMHEGKCIERRIQGSILHKEEMAQKAATVLKKI